MKRAVVSFANNQYLSKLERLKESLKGKTDADIITFTEYEQIGCKPHSEIPYQFKPYAIQAAINMGYDSILWCDSPIVAIKDVSPVFEYIEKHGYVFFNNVGHPLGKWSHDKALSYYGKTREEAMNIKQTMQCCFGLNMNDDNAKRFFDEYIGVSENLYPGLWGNSRHDQMVASFVIDKMGLEILEGHKTFFIYEHFKQVQEFQPIAESVCLVSK
jgi:hypothetical protein